MDMNEKKVMDQKINDAEMEDVAGGNLRGDLSALRDDLTSDLSKCKGNPLREDLSACGGTQLIG